jgi:hypothetical protein
MTTIAQSRRPSRLIRFLPLAGALSCLLTIAAYFVIGPNPDATASSATVSRYYADHHAGVHAAGALLGYAAVMFALFGVAVWARIRATSLHPAVAGAALVGTAIAAMSDIAYAWSWSALGDIGGKAAVTPGTLQTLHVSVASAELPSSMGVGMLLLAIATAGLAARAFPGWIAWSALVLGVVQLTPTPGLIGFFAGLAVLPWMLAAGIGMYARPVPDAAAGALQPASCAPVLQS